MGVIVPFLSRVPVWVWVVVVALGWGGWQRHLATSAASKLREHDAAIAQQTIKAQADAQAETARRLKEQADAIAESESRARTAGLAAAGARAAADRLRAQLAARSASGATGNPSAANDGETNALAGVLSQCAERYSAVAAIADAAIIAGLACQRSYQSLTIKGSE